MELSFNGGRFVSSKGDLNYKKVLHDFPNAKTIRIITYNISKNQYQDALFDALKRTNADVQIITNVPSRMERYYNTPRGEAMRSVARENIHIYISKLDPVNFPGSFKPYFNSHNHAKIIGTENIVYIGSANYSNESAGNYETGVLIEDKAFIQKLYDEFFDSLRDSDDSLSFYDENFSAFQVFLFSLLAKFEQHYHKFVSDVYTDYHRTKMVLADTIFLDTDDLDTLSWDIEELKSVCSAADDTYDEKNEAYNSELEELKERFDRISYDWLQSVISEEGPLYELVAFNEENETNRILQEEYSAEAWDENLNYYVQKSMDTASEMYQSLWDDFKPESEDFLAELEKILSALNVAISFTRKWKASKINPAVDNT